jgi:hypothetical protein
MESQYRSGAVTSRRRDRALRIGASPYIQNIQMFGITKEVNMIAVLVRFRYESGFSEARVRQVAEAARAKFEGMPELRSKAFTFDPVNREALNFYVWESEEAAKAFFSQQLIDQVTKLYGVRPTVQFADVAVLVENRAS